MTAPYLTSRDCAVWRRGRPRASCAVFNFTRALRCSEIFDGIFNKLAITVSWSMRLALAGAVVSPGDACVLREAFCSRMWAKVPPGLVWTSVRLY